MTTQLKETDPSEFTQHTMTEAEVLAHADFIAAKNVLEHRSLKPSEAMEISFPRDQWSLESIATFLRCLTPFLSGCGYNMDTAADDDNEYLSFTNKRPDSDSEFNPPDLSVKELKTYAPLEFKTYSDAELEDGFRFYSHSFAKLSRVQDGESKALAEKTRTLVESILAICLSARFAVGGRGHAQDCRVRLSLRIGPPPLFLDETRTHLINKSWPLLVEMCQHCPSFTVQN